MAFVLFIIARSYKLLLCDKTLLYFLTAITNKIQPVGVETEFLRLNMYNMKHYFSDMVHLKILIQISIRF